MRVLVASMMKKEMKIGVNKEVNTMEKYYLVTIEETLSRTIKVKANSFEDAERKVEDAYKPPRCEIILAADDYMETSFTPREVTDEDLDLYEELEE